MTDATEVPLMRSPSGLGRKVSSRRQSAGRSWVSYLTHISTTSPVPSTSSPATSEKTITRKVSQVVLPANRRQDIPTTLGDPVDTSDDGEDGEPEKRTIPMPTTDAEAKNGDFLSPLDEVPEYPITPPLVANRRSRSTVDGFVQSLSSLRSLPRAMTHSQLHDRIPPSRRDSRSESHMSHVTVPYSRTGGSTAPGSPRRALASKHAHQTHSFAMPGILLAQPFPHHPHAYGHAQGHAHAHMHGSPAPMSTVDGSKLGTYDSEWGAESRAVADRITSFFGELGSLPWVSPRVSVDYVPGRSQPVKNSSSWYTISAPSSPSDLSQVSQLVPEPWFPPVRAAPSPIVEQRGEGDQEVDAEDEESAQQKLERMKSELREKNEALQNMRQVVDHQKRHIGSLEEDLRRAEELKNLERRRSSLRRSLRVRDSLRMSRVSARKTSVRVSSVEY